MPVKEVARAIKDGLHVTFAEVSALNNGIDSFEDIGGLEFEGTRNEEAFRYVGVINGEADKSIFGVDGNCIGV